MLQAESLKRQYRWIAGLLVLFLAPAACLRGQDNERLGFFVSIPSNLAGENVSRLLTAIAARSEALKPEWLQLQRDAQGNLAPVKIVLDFNPGGVNRHSSDYESCRKLAERINHLEGENPTDTPRPKVEFIALIHGEVTGHLVLPVLACKYRYVSKQGRIGPALDKGNAAPDVRVAYQNLGKLDEKQANALLQAGRAASFTAKSIKEIAGNCHELDPGTRENLAETIKLPSSSLREVPFLEDITAWRIPVTGEVKSKLKEQLERRLRKATAAKANLIILDLRCHGGDTAVAVEIAEFLAAFNKDREDRPVEFIAHLTHEARDTAAVIALGCHTVVLDKDARIEFGTFLTRQDDDAVDVLARSLETLAQRKFLPKGLARALVDPTVGKGKKELIRARAVKPPRGIEYMAPDELAQRQNDEPGRWDSEGRIALDGHGLLTLNAEEARQHGFSQAVGDFETVCQMRGVRPSDVHEAGPDWLDNLADFLRQEYVRLMLVLIGITCLLLEVKMPGLGVPGIIAAICFVLFFWAYFQVGGGQIVWLGILLFLLGVVLIGIEIFILPGFGVCGISGIVLMLGSLALVTYGKWPQNSTEWGSLLKQIAPFGVTLIGAVVLAILLARYLPSIPYVNQLLLKPRDEEDGGLDQGAYSMQSALAGLLGAIGVAATPLRPAGKVQFGEEFVDVVAEGSYVAPGTRVQVIEVEGNRVVVKVVGTT